MRRRAIADEFEIVAARCGGSHDYAENRTMIAMIESWHPSFVQFINPGLYLVYFRGRRKKAHSAGLTNELKGNPAFGNVRIGTGYGQLVAQTSLLGRIVSAPLGEAVNQAVRNVGP